MFLAQNLIPVWATSQPTNPIAMEISNQIPTSSNQNPYKLEIKQKIY